MQKKNFLYAADDDHDVTQAAYVLSLSQIKEKKENSSVMILRSLQILFQFRQHTIHSLDFFALALPVSIFS